MDCRTALEHLEVVRDDSDDLADASLALAVAHVQSCPDCEDVFHRRRHFDRRLAHVICAVPVPADLEARLLKMVGALDAVPFPASSPLDGGRIEVGGVDGSLRPSAPSVGDVPQRMPHQQEAPTRRTFIVAGLSTAACALLAWVAFAFLYVKPAVFTFHGLFEIYPIAVERLPVFDNSFPAQLPGGVWERGPIEVGPAKGFARFGEAHQAAVFQFRFPTQQDASAVGVLVVVPRQSVDLEGNELPDHADFGDVRYTTGAAPERAALVWSSADLVYVCFVPSDAEALRGLERLLSGMTA